MFVFYDWPFPHVYFAKNVAYFPYNSWLSFQRLCRLLWGYKQADNLHSAEIESNAHYAPEPARGGLNVNFQT